MNKITSTNPTTETPSVATTPVSLLPRLRFNQFTGLTKIEAEERNLPSTDKAKCRLGIDEDREISWAPANFELATHSILRGFCKKHNLKIDEFCAAVVMTWVDDNLVALEAEAAQYIAAAHTAESAQKKMESLQRQMVAAQKLIDSLKPTK